jgi:hypothetical protein
VVTHYNYETPDGYRDIVNAMIGVGAQLTPRKYPSSSITSSRLTVRSRLPVRRPKLPPPRRIPERRFWKRLHNVPQFG